MPRCLVAILAAGICCAGLAAQQVADRLAERWRWRQLDGGLPASTLGRLDVDGRGRLVTVVDGAIWRYDGAWLRFASAPEVDTTITDFACSGETMLALLASTGSLRVAAVDASGALTDLALDVRPRGSGPFFALQGGSVLIDTGDALIDFDGRELAAPIRFDLRPHGAQRDSAGALWLTARSTDGRSIVVRQAGDGFEEVAHAESETPFVGYGRILADGDSLWFLPRESSVAAPMLHWDGTRWQVGSRRVAHLGSALVGPGRVIVAEHDGRIAVHEPTRASQVALPEIAHEPATWLGLAHGDRLVLRTLSDRLWVCDLASTRWSRHAIGADPDGGIVRALAPARAGGIWVATDAGVLRFDDGRVLEVFTDALGTSLREVTTVLEDETGDLWVGSGSRFHGVLRLHDGAWTHESEAFGPHCVHAIRAGPDGALFFALLSDVTARFQRAGGGIVRMHRGIARRFDLADGLPSDRCYDIAFGPDHRVFAGTLDGVAEFDGERWHALPETRGIQARVVHVDGSGGLWIGLGANARGVRCVRDGRFVAVPVEVANVSCADILDARRGGVWVVSPAGLYLVCDDAAHCLSMPGEAPLRSFWPGLETAPDRLWLGSMARGLVELRRDDTLAPHVDMLVATPALHGGSAAFAWSGHDAWGATGQNELAYLHRVDSGEWSPRTTARTVELDATPGPHTFEVRAVDHDGNLGASATIDFSVAWPWHARPRVVVPLGLGVLVLCTLSFLVARSRRVQRLARRRAREQLAASERHFRGLIEGAEIMFASFDHDGQPTYLTPALLRVAPDFAQSGLDSLVAHLVDSRHTTHDAGRTVSGEVRVGGGPIPTRWLYVAIRHRQDSTSQTAADLVALDVTDRHDTRARDRHLEKLELLGLLAAGISHDFNNVLTVLLGHQDILRQGLERALPTGHTTFNALSAVEDASQRAVAITRQLLAFSRSREHRPEVLDVNSVLESMAGMLRGLTREDIEIVWRLSSQRLRVRIDPGEFQQIVMNLVVNASAAMSSGGHLTIATDARNGDDRQPHVALIVTDDGIGIPQHVLPRIFDPFFTTKLPGEGAGLGLATVRRIVEEARGTIRVHSAVGEGATFVILLPRAEADSSVTGPLASEAGDSRRAVILICEDDAAVRNFARSVLVDAGHTVLSTGAPREALEIARSAERLDLVITDVVMPDLNGVELANAIARDRPDLPVVFMSGYAATVLDPGDVPGRFLAKPFRGSELLEIVRGALPAASGGRT